MKRVHVLEFEDLPWFPAWLRACMTNVIVTFGRKMGVVSVLAHLIPPVLERHGLRKIVDLGSGSGGTMPDVVAEIRAKPDTAEAELLMTDLFPNPEAVERFGEGGAPHVAYHPEPVDAARLSDAPRGLRTMINCFHHMRPAQAKSILSSARDSGEPILIYEMADNRIPFVVWLVTLPLGLAVTYLMCLVLTLFVRPLTFRQVFFTYVIPVIPLFYAWDGQASFPRIYTLEDLDELLQGLDGDGYRWEKGPATDANGRTFGIYLLGEPT